VIPNSKKLSYIRDHYMDEVIGKQIFSQVTSVSYIDNPLAVRQRLLFPQGH